MEAPEGLVELASLPKLSVLDLSESLIDDEIVDRISEKGLLTVCLHFTTCSSQSLSPD